MENAELLHNILWFYEYRSLGEPISFYCLCDEYGSQVAYTAELEFMFPLFSVVAIHSTPVWREWNFPIIMEMILCSELGVSVKKEHRALLEVQFSQWHGTAMCFSLSALQSALRQTMKPPLHMQSQALLSCNVWHAAGWWYLRKALSIMRIRWDLSYFLEAFHILTLFQVSQPVKTSAPVSSCNSGRAACSPFAGGVVKIHRALYFCTYKAAVLVPPLW